MLSNQEILCFLWDLRFISVFTKSLQCTLFRTRKIHFPLPIYAYVSQVVSSIRCSRLYSCRRGWNTLIVLHAQSILSPSLYRSCDVRSVVPDVWLLILQPCITCCYFFLLGPFWVRLWSHSTDLNVDTALDTNWRKMLFYKTKNKTGSHISARRSLLSECYVFAGYTCKCNLMHVR